MFVKKESADGNSAQDGDSKERGEDHKANQLYIDTCRTSIVRWTKIFVYIIRLIWINSDKPTSSFLPQFLSCFLNELARRRISKQSRKRAQSAKKLDQVLAALSPQFKNKKPIKM